MTPRYLCVLLSALALAAAAAQARAVQGQGDPKVVYNNACRTCHSMKEGDNRLGPSLHGVVGRKAGAVAGYAYSASMKNSGITWDEKTLDAFIANPDQVVNGNSMKPYGGITEPGQRRQIIAFLKSISGK